MMSPMNTKEMVDLHNRDLARLVEPRRWQVARRQALASFRRRRNTRDARAR